MRILVVGATGTIGSAVAAALAEKYDVIGATRRSGVRVDIEDPTLIAAMYEKLGRIDAVVSAAGDGAFGELSELSDEDYARGLRSKLMGQVNLVRRGIEAVNDGGSFTLTSGILSREPWAGTTGLALLNGALESFARAAALELPRGLRINVICPGWVTETLLARGMDPAPGQPAASVARAYVESVEGTRNGETLLTREFA